MIFILGFLLLINFSNPTAQATGFAEFEVPAEVEELPDQDGTATAVEFAVLGDFGSGLEQEALVAKMIAGWNIDFIISTGDNYYSAAGGGGGNGLDQLDNSVGAFYCPFLKDTGTPNSGTTDCPEASQSATNNRFFPAIGNHERINLQNGLDDYLNYFSLPGSGMANSSGEERYYDFVQGPVHFFVLDSDSALQNASDMAAQKAWLERELAQSTSPWQVVTLHHAAYSSSRHGSQAAMQWPFGAWGADAVFQGHDHTYERIHQDGIVYFVSGYGGKSLYDFGRPIPGSVARFNGNYGALKVKASPKALVFEAWSVAVSRLSDSTVSAVIVDSYVLGEVPECDPAQDPPLLAVEECLDEPTAQILNRAVTAVYPAPLFIFTFLGLVAASLLVVLRRRGGHTAY